MVDPLEKLKLTEGGGRRGEKGYSDSREQECVVTIKQAGSEGTVEGGRQGRQGTEAAYFASSGPKRQKKMTRRMGKLDKTRKGRLGKDCEEWDTYDSLQGVLHPVGEWLRPLTGPTGSRRSESDHRSCFFKLPRDCHCTDPSG